MKKNLLLFLSLISIFVLSCKEDSPTESAENNQENTYNFNYEMNVSPDIGGLNTEFKFSFTEIDGKSIDSLDYYIDLDIDGDGVFDKRFYNIDSVKTDFNFLGKKIISSKLVINKTEILCSAEVIVVDRVRIVEGDRYSFFHEPHIYNSQNITVTGGYGRMGHTLNMINIDGSDERCLFCDYPKIYSGEMHCSQLSFDGNKIIWDSGLKVYYYDFNSGEDTAKVIFNAYYYEQGRMCWSIDDSKIFIISNGGNGLYDWNGVGYIDLNDNFKVKKITDFGDFICIVPGNNDLLAIMERNNASQSNSSGMSDIKFYSLSQNKVVKEFNGIKGFDYFRIIDNGNKIFMGDPFSIYDFNSGKYYNIDFNEFVFEGIGYFQSDITYNGDKIVFSVFDKTAASANVNLYMFSLPIDQM